VVYTGVPESVLAECTEYVSDAPTEVRTNEDLLMLYLSTKEELEVCKGVIRVVDDFFSDNK